MVMAPGSERSIGGVEGGARTTHLPYYSPNRYRSFESVKHWLRLENAECAKVSRCEPGANR